MVAQCFSQCSEVKTQQKFIKVLQVVQGIFQGAKDQPEKKIPNYVISTVVEKRSLSSQACTGCVLSQVNTHTALIATLKGPYSFTMLLIARWILPMITFCFSYLSHKDSSCSFQLQDTDVSTWQNLSHLPMPQLSLCILGIDFGRIGFTVREIPKCAKGMIQEKPNMATVHYSKESLISF